MWKHFAAPQLPVDNIPKVDLTPTTIGGVLSAVFMLIGGLAILFMLIGAVRYVTSNGDQSMVKQAKDTILYGIIGVVVSLSAFAVVQLVVGTLSI